MSARFNSWKLKFENKIYFSTYCLYNYSKCASTFFLGRGTLYLSSGTRLGPFLLCLPKENSGFCPFSLKTHPSPWTPSPPPHTPIVINMMEMLCFPFQPTFPPEWTGLTVIGMCGATHACAWSSFPCSGKRFVWLHPHPLPFSLVLSHWVWKMWDSREVAGLQPEPWIEQCWLSCAAIHSRTSASTVLCANVWFAHRDELKHIICLEDSRPIH